MGSHFCVGGMEHIMIPHQVSLVITDVLKLSTAAFLVRKRLIYSWISVPSTYLVLLSASWAWEHHISVLFPHLVWIDPQASFAVPVVFTLRLWLLGCGFESLVGQAWVKVVCAASDDPKMVKTLFAPMRISNEHILGGC